jgi:hypothetical protein
MSRQQVNNYPEEKGGRMDENLRTLYKSGMLDERQTAIHPKVVRYGRRNPEISIQTWLAPAYSMRQGCIIRGLFPRNQAGMGQKGITRNIIRLD